MKSRTNTEWVHELTTQGDEQDAAIADLRLFLVRAALYAFTRHRGNLAHLADREIEQLTEDSAQEAQLAIPKHLPEFRSSSKFTTWAH